MTSTDFATLKNFAPEIQPDDRYIDEHHTLDLHWVMYDSVLNLTPETVDSPDRDRYLISKGHRSTAYYLVLAQKGYIPFAWIDDMYGPESPLGGHPDRTRIPAVEISSGSLGHGLPLALGMHEVLRARGRRRPHVYVLIGDAELEEGSNHEAIAYAGLRSMRGLTVIVDDNRSALRAWGGDIAPKFAVHGWSTRSTPAYDHTALAEAVTAHHPDKPNAVIVEQP
ncbi:hypothetical protein [Haloglycomyces albus]|uniref:hypothetical protein n=1 Tax=Haloglycomyces albus TaxID=526067 RepID=UPI00046CE981|nr:hypothetical protein [Haloglycomyces albus]